MDNDIPQLPTDTLQLLREFQSEKDIKAKQFEDLRAKADNDFQDTHSKLSIDMFGEDWNASQFWYTDDTANILARQLLHNVTADSAIAVVSAPSVYIALRNIISTEPMSSQPQLCLLEYDRRFEVLGSDFEFYDYAQPLRLSNELKGKFDRIICDPPFLSEDCQTKTALTARFLARAWSTSDIRFISCTGERMERTMLKLYSNISIHTTSFEPKHTRGLSNEFRCYANFECDDWNWTGYVVS